MKFLLLAVMIFSALGNVHTQQTVDEARILRNQDIVEMVKSGLSDSVIIAKIKNSPTQFNTSTAALKEMIDHGATNPLILAMIEAKPKSQSLDTNQTPVDLKEIVGKNRVFIESNDDEVKLVLIKEAKKQKFEVMNDPTQADLIFDMRVRTEAISYKPGMFRGGLERTTEARLCNLSVYLRTSDGRRIAYAKDIRSIYDDSPFARLFGDGSVSGVKLQVLALLKSFVDERKKATKAK